MASRIHRVWATCCRQTLLCLQNHWCQGETGSIWWNTALVLPLPFSVRREAREKKKGEELKRNWKRRGREERQGGKGERLDKMNYAKLSEAAIVGGAGCVKGSQSWSSPAPSTTQHSQWLRAVWSVLRQMANNKMRTGGGREMGQATWWQVDCLGGTQRQWQVRSLLPLFAEVTDREIWVDLYSGPHGNIITKQRLSEELPYQQSGQRWPLCFSKCFVCWSQEHAAAQFKTLCLFIQVHFTKNSSSVPKYPRNSTRKRRLKG